MRQAPDSACMGTHETMTLYIQATGQSSQGICMRRRQALTQGSHAYSPCAIICFGKTTMLALVGDATLNCTRLPFTPSDRSILYIIKLAVSCAALLACAAAIIIIVALKDYKKFIYRLVLYLMITSLIYAIILILELLPVELSDKDNGVSDRYTLMCVITGFLSQVAVWMYVLLICWIVLYLVLLAVFKYNANQRRQEITGLCIVLALPLVFNWIPFLHDMYGLSGLWCWIRTVPERCDRPKYVLGLIYQITLFYGPISLMAFFGFCSFISICVVLFREACRRSTGLRIISDNIPHVRALRGSLPLVTYPLLFSLIFSVMLANRIDYSVAVHAGSQPSYPLWLAHAIADPLFTLFPPLAFIFHPSTLKKLYTSFRRPNPAVSTQAETTYIVPKEFSSSDEPLIIRGEERAPNPRPYYSTF